MANSVEKTIQVLRTLADSRGRAVTLSDLSDKTGINKSTLSHIIKVLCGKGYVTRVSHREGYTVGPELFFLTRYGRFGEEITSSCHSILELLNRETGGTAIFAVLNGDKKYIIDYIEGQVRYTDSPAFILSDDLYRTVTGRVLLSRLSVHEATEIFRQNGPPKEGHWDTVKSEKDYQAELSKIRRMSCLCEILHSESCALISLAAPIYKSQKCIASLGLVLEKSEETNTKRLEALFLRCVREAERRLEFR